MQFRHPAAVIDEVLADLGYLTEFLLDDIDHSTACGNDISPCAMKAVAALDAVRVLLPRLRIVRSNFVTDSRLPDSSAGAGLLDEAVPEQTDDASETSAASGNAGLLR